MEIWYSIIMQAKMFLFWYWGFLSLFTYSQLSGFTWEKNKSCTQHLAICKPETCKGHLQKVVPFTLAKRKCTSYNTMKFSFFLARPYTDKSWYFQVDYVLIAERKHLARSAFLGQIFVACTWIMLSSNVICTSKCHREVTFQRRHVSVFR